MFQSPFPQTILMRLAISQRRYSINIGQSFLLQRLEIEASCYLTLTLNTLSLREPQNLGVPLRIMYPLTTRIHHRKVSKSILRLILPDSHLAGCDTHHKMFIYVVESRLRGNHMLG